MAGAIVVLIAIAVLVAFVLLEGRRQRRKYGSGGGRGASLMGVGMLEIQKHLQPDRRVDVLLMQETREDAERETDAHGDDVERMENER